jgi:hypothetical protein
MWKYYFNCNGPVVIEAGNLGEAQALCSADYGCNPCQFLGCDPPGCAGNVAGLHFRPDVEWLRVAEQRKLEVSRRQNSTK